MTSQWLLNDKMVQLMFSQRTSKTTLCFSWLPASPRLPKFINEGGKTSIQSWTIHASIHRITGGVLPLKKESWGSSDHKTITPQFFGFPATLKVRGGKKKDWLRNTMSTYPILQCHLKRWWPMCRLCHYKLGLFLPSLLYTLLLVSYRYVTGRRLGRHELYNFA